MTMNIVAVLPWASVTTSGLQSLQRIMCLSSLLPKTTKDCAVLQTLCSFTKIMLYYKDCAVLQGLCGIIAANFARSTLICAPSVQ